MPHVAYVVWLDPVWITDCSKFPYTMSPTLLLHKYLPVSPDLKRSAEAMISAHKGPCMAFDSLFSVLHV